MQKGITEGCFDSFWQWACIFSATQLLLGQLPHLGYL